jgi:bacteriorhodopsin
VNYRLERVGWLVRDVVTQPMAHWGYWTVGIAAVLLLVAVWMRPKSIDHIERHTTD